MKLTPKLNLIKKHAADGAAVEDARSGGTLFPSPFVYQFASSDDARLDEYGDLFAVRSGAEAWLYMEVAPKTILSLEVSEKSNRMESLFAAINRCLEGFCFPQSF